MEQYTKNTNYVSNTDQQNIRCAAQPPGSILFNHQLYVKFYLRPFSPIRKLIINARTGSGKMRMLQEVLENFACYPNRKIIVFSTDQLRREFYTKYVSPFSHFYLKDKNRIIPAVTPEQVGGKWVQRLDLFNKIYSHQGDQFGVQTGEIPFETYVQYDKDKHVRGATIVLTYPQFRDLMTSHTMEGAYNFYTKRVDGQFEFDLSGAMVLFDEAHLLCEGKNTDILKVLAPQVPRIACLGLFTATPANNVEDLQQKFHSLVGSTEKVSDYMISYHENTPGLFNTEHIEFVRVPSTQVLKTRQEITKNRNIGVLTELWFPYLLLQNQTVQKWNQLTNDMLVGDNIQTEGIKDILEQPRLIDQHRAIMNSKNLTIWSMFFPKLATVFQSIVSNRDYTKTARHVVMISESRGLYEMSQLLRVQKKPHIIINIELFKRPAPIQQVNLIELPVHMDFRHNRQNGRILDDDLLSFIHSEACGPEVIIVYNSFLPEGISLYRITHMHIIDVDEKYGNVQQMMGRINRICHPTDIDPKIIRFYCMEPKCDSLYQQFHTPREQFTQLVQSGVLIT
jgi:hypothetical protein